MSPEEALGKELRKTTKANTIARLEELIGSPMDQWSDQYRKIALGVMEVTITESFATALDFMEKY